MNRIFATLALITAATAGHAGPGGVPDGTYDAVNCAAQISDGRVVLKGSELEFYESTCALTSPQGLRGMTGPVLVDAVCSGEGESWQTRFILSQASGRGLAILGDGTAQFYTRCD